MSTGTRAGRVRRIECLDLESSGRKVGVGPVESVIAMTEKHNAEQSGEREERVVALRSLFDRAATLRARQRRVTDAAALAREARHELELRTSQR